MTISVQQVALRPYGEINNQWASALQHEQNSLHGVQTLVEVANNPARQQTKEAEGDKNTKTGQ